MTSPNEPPRSTLPPVMYKGEPLDAERGPGLGCFWTQLVVLAVLIVGTPLSVYAGWPSWASAALLFITILLLLFAGQTIIFLLRLVAAERRQGRRRPMATARTRTVGELEDETATEDQTDAPETAADGYDGDDGDERDDATTEPPGDPHVRE